MKSRSSNFYPPEGHDWIPTVDIRRAIEHNDALAVEKYTHDVGAFRKRLFDILVSNNAIGVEGFGWAMYVTTEAESDATATAKEVVITSRPRADEGIGGHIVPLIRIITNEPIVNDGHDFYLTEDITVEPNGNAQYLTSGIRMAGDENRKLFAENMETSLAPLFLIVDGKLALSDNLRPVTPVINVASSLNSRNFVRPFGSQDVISDKIYALDKANGILSSVIDVTPIGQLKIE